MGLWSFIKGEWDVLKAAPVTFVVLLVLGVVTGFTGGVLLKEQEVANLNSLVRLKSGELEELKKMERRLDAVEKHLSSQQIDKLESALKEGAPGKVVFSPGELEGYSSGTSDQLKGAFEKSGWQVYNEIKSTDGFIVRTTGMEDTEAVEKALREAGIFYQSITERSGSTKFRLGMDHASDK